MQPRPRRRWYVLPTLAGMLALAAVGTVLVRSQERRLWREEVAKLEAIATLKASGIAAWRAERLRDAGLLAPSAHFGEVAATWLATGDHEVAETIQRYFAIKAELYGYADVLLVDRHGRVRLRLRGEGGDLHPEAKATVERALASGAPALTDLHLGEDGAAYLGAVAPLPAAGGSSPGAFILQSNAEQFLFPLIRTWPLPSRTAESLLVRREAGHALFLNELLHEHHTALRLKLPMSREELPAVRAVRGESGPFAGRDYRGVEVLATWRAVPDSPWFLIAKIDREEAFTAARQQLRLLVSLLIALGAAGVALAVAAWQRAARAHLQESLRLAHRLQASEARHAVTLQSIGDAVLTTDRQGRVELLNPVACRLTGWNQEEAAGRPLREVFRIVNETTRQPVEDPVARVLREGKVVGLANHTLLLARDGRETPIADAGAPIRAGDGEILGVVLNFRDQSAERAAQKALQDSEAFVRTVLDNLPVGVAVNAVAPTVAFSYFNEAFCRHYRVTAEALANPDGFWEAAYPDPAQREEVRRRVLEDCASGDPERMRWEDVAITRPGEPTIHLSARNMPLPRTGQMLSLVWDVTDRRRLEQQLAQAQRLETIGTLAGGIAHDFNNLLQALLATVQTAQRKGGNGLFRDTFADLEALIRRGADLTRQLLLFARQQPGRRQPVDLAGVLREQAALLRRLLPETIQVVVETPASGLLVEGDASQLAQVVTNLAINARDAMPAGGTLTLRATATNGEVHLEVRDTGVGMSEEMRARIFDPFFTTKPLGKGTGLGLAVVWGIVEGHGGHIEVDSAPGAGTAVRIALPAASPAAAAEDEAEISSGDRLAVGAGEQVLLVEDEEAARAALAEMLAELGYEVTAVRSAEEAQRLPGEPAYHLLLTDYLLPGATGLQLANALGERWPGLKVVIMSGYAPDDVAASLLASGQRHFLQKPFDMKALAKAMRAALHPVAADRPVVPPEHVSGG